MKITTNAILCNATLDMVALVSQAALTNRLIDGDPKFERPEWSEPGTIDGIPVIVYYRTTPEDDQLVEAVGGDWGAVDWPSRVDRIAIDLDECDRRDIAASDRLALLHKYNA